MRNYPNFEWIIDDESYFTLSHSEINGNNIYYTSDDKQCPDNVKFKEKSKFEDKLFVWIAISPKGMPK